eukprot:GEMP01105390.1.p1 GENE.GEMP01105390.1~~GEMP01105390.1.p1  ORF type:complete len:117 (+),score=14.30 GEMP01105390.1:38-388(+)
MNSNKTQMLPFTSERTGLKRVKKVYQDLNLLSYLSTQNSGPLQNLLSRPQKFSRKVKKSKAAIIDVCAFQGKFNYLMTQTSEPLENLTSHPDKPSRKVKQSKAAITGEHAFNGKIM